MSAEAQQPGEAVAPERPLAPPTSPATPLARPHVWPTALGIVLIVLGSGAILGGAWSALGSVMLSQLTLHTDEMSPLVEDMEPLSAVQAISGIFGAMLGGLCLAGGIGLLRRRLWGVLAARVWAILKILYGVLASAAIALFQLDLMSSVTHSGAAPPPGFGGAFFGAFAFVFFLMSVCWLVALPIFVLLWLRRQEVAREIARWRATHTPEAR